MTTLATPTLQRRLLQTVGEAVANDRFGETIRLGVGIVREVREDIAREVQEFEDELSRGVEARSFVGSHGPILDAWNEAQVQLRRLLEVLASAEGTVAEPFLAELRLLEQETTAFRERLAEAVSLASQPPPAIDWDRLKRESDADFAAGRFTTYERPEDMHKGLAGGD